MLFSLYVCQDVQNFPLPLSLLATDWIHCLRHWVHLGSEWQETKDGFKCISKKNIVPRGPKLKWLAAMGPQKFPTSDLVQFKVEVLGHLGPWGIELVMFLLVFVASVSYALGFMNGALAIPIHWLPHFSVRAF